MTQRIFVFRVSKGNESGKPNGKCPLDYTEIKRKIASIPQEEIRQIEYSDEKIIPFISDELYSKNILRQGWGLDNLNLNQDIKNWIENYMESAYRYWSGYDCSCDEAKGRHNILKRMLDMSLGDILILPKSSSKYLNDYDRFTVCQVAEKYYFDLPTDFMDFGHCIKVKNLQEFNYSDNTLLGKDFGAPYMWAITEVKNYHSRYEKISNFINLYYSNVLKE
jgi:hypothetical protein